MYNVFLTQSGGFLGAIASILGLIMNGLYEFLGLFDIANVGIAIILFTFIARGLMIPFTIKQQKFSKLSAIMNPEIAKIQSKYKGKKDQDSLQKQQLETQAVYEKYGASPTAGCLPLLITFPLMLALYQVIRNVPAYVHDIYGMYKVVADAIQGTNGYVGTMQDFAATVKVNTNSFKELAANGTISTNHIIDILSKLKPDQWTVLANEFPKSASIINDSSREILNVNKFIGGLNILNNPGFKFPGILIPILSAVLSYFQTKQISASNPTDKDNPMAASMNTMNNVMPIMSGIFCLTFPIGIGLYWIAGSAFAIVQQAIINKHMDKVDIQDLIKKNVEKANKKKAKKGITSSSIEELAKKQTKSIDSKAEQRSNSTKDFANAVKKNYDTTVNNDVSYKPGSLSANANLLKNRNKDKGEK